MTQIPSVWIVDDDRSIRWVLEKALSGAGINASSFADAESLSRRLARETPDAIISDIRMPGIDGLQLLAHLIHRSFCSDCRAPIRSTTLDPSFDRSTHIRV